MPMLLIPGTGSAGGATPTLRAGFIPILSVLTLLLVLWGVV